MTNTKKPATAMNTGKVRFSFVHLLEPVAMQEGAEAKYSAMILIPKSDTETLEKIDKAIKAAAEAGKANKFNGKIPAKLNTTLRDGDEEQDTDEYPEFKGMMFMNVSSKTKPGIVGTQRDSEGKLKAIEDEDEIYSGMYGRASLNFFAYNTSGNKGVSAGLNNVQKIADGERLGGGKRKAEDDFDDWEDDTDDDDLLG